MKYSALLLLGFLATTQFATAEESPQESITVTGAQMQSFFRADIPDIDTARSENSFSAKFLRDHGSVRLSDILRLVPGAVPDGYARSFDLFRLRGFSADNALYLDGMAYDQTQQFNAEIFGIERVSIVRGPTSATDGGGMPGGMVNLTSKRPEPERNFLRMGAAGERWNGYELNIDGNRALADTLTGRFAGVLRHTGDLTRGSTGNTRFYAAPSLLWQPDEDTDLTLLASYQHDRLNMEMPLPAEGTVYAGTFGKIALDTNIENPGRSNIIRATRWQLGYILRHSFSPHLTLHSKLRLNGNDQKWWRVLYPVLQVGQYLYRTPLDSTGNWNNITTDHYLTADFTTGGLDHQLTAGGNFRRYAYRGLTQTTDTGSLAGYMLLDMKNPDYADEVFPEYTGSTAATAHMSDLGLYAEDHIRWGNLHFSAGGRWDKAYTEDDGQRQHDAHLSPNAGINWNFRNNTHAYASYSVSFMPQSGTTYAGVALQPEHGRQWEVGLKSGHLNNRLYLTLALYTISRSNVARSDPAHTNYYLTTGRQRARGAELSARWDIRDNWQSLISYSYTDARVMADPSYPKGDQLLGVPQNSISLWNRYGFTGLLFGLSVCGSLNHYASQAGDMPNSFRLPAYTLLGTGLSYHYGPARLSLNVQNLLNSRYFAGSESALTVLPGMPRSLRLSLQMAL